jgi:type IV secretion system protein VirB5
MKEAPDYMSAKREWLERYGSYIAEARNWRLLAVGSLLVSAMFGAGLVYEAQRVKVVPFVVAMDKLGETVRLAQAVQAGATQQPIVTHLLTNWLVKVRERISDPKAADMLMKQTYQMATQDSSTALNAYYKDNSPFAAVGNVNLGSRTVQIESALPMGTPTATAGSYQITWTETDSSPQGIATGTQKWVGIVQYEALPTTNDTTDQLLDNPFGIYVSSFQFQKSL